MPTTAVQRVRDHRRRTKQHRRLLTVEVDLEQVAGLLMANGSLKENESTDEKAISRALSQFIDVLADNSVMTK